MKSFIIDKLYDRVEKNGVVCIGLDTDVSYIPKNLISKHTRIEDAIFEFNRKIIDATEDVSACFKVQIAYYEALGLNGLVAYKRTLEYLREKKLITIADIKRGDIAATAKMYAKAHFEGDFESDFITLSPYMGMDSIDPYASYLEKGDKGVFVLVRTSNTGAHDLQYCNLEGSKKVYMEIGKKLCLYGKNFLGNNKYSSIGGVVGCTHTDEAIAIRKSLDTMFFLIPGYGAQGGKAKDVALYLKDGNGGVVNSSRKILLAYKEEENNLNFDIAARNEAIRMRDDINKAICDIRR